MNYCILCGGAESASTHREPYGRAMAYVFYTHAFQAPQDSVSTSSESGQAS